MARFEEALQFAAEAHEGKLRKGSINPFVLHPMETAVIASNLTADEDVIIAALLHDTIEDADVTADMIKAKFGPRVLALVLADTEPEGITDWMERKTVVLRYLKHRANRDEKIVIFADRLSNLRSIYNDMSTMGGDVWAVFHEQSDASVQEWYYREVVEHIDEFRGTPAYEEYKDLLFKVFRK